MCLVLAHRLHIRQGWKRYQWRRSAYISSALVLVVLLFINSCSEETAFRHLKGSTMGTFYTVTYRADIATSELKTLLDENLSEIETQLSNWDKESWISRFNNSHGTDLVSIPRHAYQVVKYTLELSSQTKQALDPTLGKLINLWGFGPVKGELPPTDKAIQKAMKATGSKKIMLRSEPTRIAKSHPELQLNVSSVAKGYAVDLLAQELEKKGITDYLINIGGEMRVSGQPESKSVWKIAIQKPAPESRDGQAHVTIELNKAGLATSGDYRRFLEIDGKSYPHILDPETGWPVQTNLASTTIIAPTAMQADGLATACLVLGPQKAQKLINEMPNVEGLFIQRIDHNQYRTFTTLGWPVTKLQILNEKKLDEYNKRST